MRDFVERALDDDFVGADAVHLVVDAVAALVEVALDLQGGELVGHHADAPALFVGLRVAVAVGEDLVRRVVLAALAEGAEALPAGSGSALGPTGRLARSVAMITQRPTIGSLRNSGIGNPRIWEPNPRSVSSITRPT